MKVKCISALLVVLTSAMLLICVLWSSVTMDPISETRDIVLRMAVPNAEKHPNTLTAVYFSNLVMEKSAGRICIELYPEAQLGSQEASLEQLKFGGIDFAIVESHILLDYMYGDDANEENLSSGEDEETLVTELVDEDLSKWGLEALACFEPDYRCIANNSRDLQQDSAVDDLTLLVSGTYMMDELLSRRGFDVVFQEGMDIRKALRNQFIDGAEMAFLNYMYDDYGMIMPHVILLDSPDISGVLLSSKSSMGAMTVEYQNIIRECAQIAASYQKQVQNQCQKEAIDYLETYGIRLYPTAAQTVSPENWNSLRSQYFCCEIEVP